MAEDASFHRFSPEPRQARLQEPRSVVERLTPLLRKIRWILFIRATAWTLAGAILNVAAFVVLDWWRRPVAVEARVLLSVFFVTTMIAYAYGCWFLFLRKRPTLESVARRFERLYPELGDRLSSAVAMERQQLDATMPAGSPISGAAIQSVVQQLIVLRPEQAIDTRAAWWSVLGAAVIFTSLVSLTTLRPEIFAKAASRLFQPMSENLWPQRDHLVFEQLPSRANRGKTVQWYLRNQGGGMPDNTMVYYRQSMRGDGDQPRVLPIRQNGEQGILIIENVQESFSVRATGGDDHSMAWQEVEVDDGVAVEEFFVRLKPPAYSGLTEVVVQSYKTKVLSGTQMVLDLQATAAVKSAMLVFQPSAERTREAEGVRYNATIDDSGKSLRFGPIELVDSGSWRLDWVDFREVEVAGQDRWDIEVQPDAIPIVQLNEPEADREITAEAIVTFARSSEDDFGIRAAWFQIEHRGLEARESEAIIRSELREFANDYPRSEQAEARVRIADCLGDSLSATFQPGIVLECRAIAEDIAGQQGESSTITLRIVSMDRIESRIAQEMSEAVEEVLEATNQQKIALEQAEAARARIKDDQAAIDEALDRLRGSAAAQLAVEQRIVGEESSALEHAEKARKFAAENNLDSEVIERLATHLRGLASVEIAEGQNSLSQATEAIGTRELQDGERKLDDAIMQQRASIEKLERLSGELQQSDQKRKLGLQMDSLLASQIRLRDEASQIHSAAEPLREQQRLAERQRDLARQANELIDQLEFFAQGVQEADSQSQDGAREAAKVLLGEDTSESKEEVSRSLESVMRDAADLLVEGRAGQTRQLQSKAEQQLDRARQRLRSDQSPKASKGEQQVTSDILLQRLKELLARQKMLVAVEDIVDAVQWSRDEFGIALETRTTANEQAPPGFSETLEDAAVDMEMAAAMAEREEDPKTVMDVAAAALRRIELVLDALSGNRNSDSGSEDSQNSSSASEGSENRPTLPMESLRLARGMQAFLRERTVELNREAEAISEEGRQSAAWIRNRQQRSAIAEEQLRLAERLNALLEASVDPSETSSIQDQ